MSRCPDCLGSGDIGQAVDVTDFVGCGRCLSTGEVDDDPQTAMLLTEQEWRDLAEMVGHYLLTTQWVERGCPREHDSEMKTCGNCVELRRQRDLASRIIEAAS